MYRMIISKKDALTMKNEPMNVTTWHDNNLGHQVLMNVPLNDNVYIKYKILCQSKEEANELAKEFTNNVQCGLFRVEA